MSGDISGAETVSTAEEILKNGIDLSGGKVSLACSFSMEDIAIIDIAKSFGLPLAVFAIDTGRLNEESYEVADAIAARYHLTIDWYFPKHENVEELERNHGFFSFRESLDKRHECCRIRKVEPLSRAINGLAGWVTGIRREQNITRSDLKAIESDNLNGGILKINPLIDWSEKELMNYTEARKLPRNRLYLNGYRSIGCAPCSRAVKQGEDARSGRWWWEDANHKECGLHRR